MAVVPAETSGSTMLQLLALALVMVALPEGRSFVLHNYSSGYGRRLVPSRLQSPTNRASNTNMGLRYKVRSDGETSSTSKRARPKTSRPRMAPEWLPWHGHGHGHALQRKRIDRVWEGGTQGRTTPGVGANAEESSKYRSGGHACSASVVAQTGVLLGSTSTSTPPPSSSSSSPAVVSSSSWTSSSMLSTHTAEPCTKLLGPEAAGSASKGSKPKADVKSDGKGGGGGSQKGSKGGGGGGGQGGEGHGGQGGRNGRDGNGSGSDTLVAASNSTNTENSYGDTHKLSSGSLDLESGVSVDQGLVRRSPLLRITAPMWTFLRSRAGLYGIMLGYVVFTLSQHISPVYVGMSILTVLSPTPARKLLVLATQSLSVLTVLSYIQDQFRHQVYPLPSVAAGPSAPYAVITGGSSGIGREIANELAGRGYNILLVARGQAGLEKAAKELEEASRAAAEAKNEESDDGRPDHSERKSRRQRNRRLRRERKEKTRRRSGSQLPAQSASSSSSPAASLSSSASPSASPAASTSISTSGSTSGSRSASAGSPQNSSGKEDASSGIDPAIGLSSNSSASSDPAQPNARSDRHQESEQERDEKRDLQPPQQQEQQQQQRPQQGRGGEEALVAPDVAKTITARWFAADLGNATAAQAVHDEVQRLNLTVDVLVNAAGICRVGRVEKMTDQDLEGLLMLNVVGTSRLTRLFAKDFAAKRNGRIMMVSSVVSAVPNPTVAAYAASKSYLTSFAEALHSELEVSGVGVTCVMPGATRTSFQGNSGSSKALVWQLPLVSMEADEVAARAVEALLRGDRTVVPGWQNKLYVHVLAPLLPRKIVMTFVEAMWR